MKYALSFAAAAALAATAALAGEMGDKGMCMDGKAMDAKLETHFKEVDANADGKVTETELVDFVTAKAKKEFASMAGDDAAATLDEMKAHHHAMHEEMMKEHAAADDSEHKDGHH